LEKKISRNLNIITALFCEAKSLIEFYKLKKNIDIAAYDIFENHDKTIKLIISGIGPVNAAAATAFIFCYGGNNKNDLFLNIGIAGSYNLEFGKIYAVSKIINIDNGKKFYPPFLKFHKSLENRLLNSYAKAQLNYQIADSMVDMEAAAIMEAGLRFVEIEQIQFLKIISDNKFKQVRDINAEMVESCINNNLGKIVDFVSLFTSFFPDDNLQDIVGDLVLMLRNKLKISKSNEIKITNKIARLLVFMEHQNIADNLAKYSDFKQLQCYLDQELEQISL
jgi:nucleoside phosphorylase